MAYVVSSGILGFLAQSGWKISTAVSSIMVVLVFGAGTDYCIFMISRFREELAAREDTRFEGGTREAVIATAGSISTVIIASATTVAIGFMGLAVATYGMIKTMGPSLALAIGVTLLPGLTLTPALMAILGDKMFWPFHARIFAEPEGEAFQLGKLAAYVTRNAKIVAPVLIILLLIPLHMVAQVQAVLRRAVPAAQVAGVGTGLRSLERPLQPGRYEPGGPGAFNQRRGGHVQGGPGRHGFSPRSCPAWRGSGRCDQPGQPTGHLRQSSLTTRLTCFPGPSRTRRS